MVCRAAAASPLYSPLTGRVIKRNSATHKNLVARISGMSPSAWKSVVSRANPHLPPAQIDVLASWWLSHVGKGKPRPAVTQKTALSKPKIKYVTNAAGLAQEIRSAGLVVVDFFAKCAPTKVPKRPAIWY